MSQNYENYENVDEDLLILREDKSIEWEDDVEEITLKRMKITTENEKNPKRQINNQNKHTIVQNEFSQLNESEKKFLEQEKNKFEEMKKCKEINNRMMRKPEATYAFNVPVDPIALGVPTYFSVIKNPMDLGTIDKKLNDNKYENKEEFNDDVLLVFDNATLFNHPDSEVYKWAVKLKAAYKDMFKREFDKFEMNKNRKNEKSISSTPFSDSIKNDLSKTRKNSNRQNTLNSGITEDGNQTIPNVPDVIGDGKKVEQKVKKEKKLKDFGPKRPRGRPKMLNKPEKQQKPKNDDILIPNKIHIPQQPSLDKEGIQKLKDLMKSVEKDKKKVDQILKVIGVDRKGKTEVSVSLNHCTQIQLDEIEMIVCGKISNENHEKNRNEALNEQNVLNEAMKQRTFGSGMNDESESESDLDSSSVDSEELNIMRMGHKN